LSFHRRSIVRRNVRQCGDISLQLSDDGVDFGECVSDPRREVSHCVYHSFVPFLDDDSKTIRESVCNAFYAFAGKNEHHVSLPVLSGREVVGLVLDRLILHRLILHRLILHRLILHRLILHRLIHWLRLVFVIVFLVAHHSLPFVKRDNSTQAMRSQPTI
jgi:hypothetical protein